jgi:nucleoside-diphosphate-sugar epimerase
VKVLVTGATGFIGGRLVENLARRGHQIRALAREASDKSLLTKLDVEIVNGDIRDAGAMNQAVQGCECVYHLAAKITKDGLSRREYYAHNVEGTKNVAQAALAASVNRFVYASSIGVFGTFSDSTIDENTAAKPDSYYRETKFRAEQEVLRLHQQRGLPAVVARVGSVYGPGSCSWLGLCRKILKGNFQIIGTGENYDHMVCVDDLVEGLRRCGEVNGVEGRTYILAGPDPATLREVLGLIAEELGVKSDLGSLPITPFRAYKHLCGLVYRSFKVELPRSHYYDLFLTDHIFRTRKAQEELSYFPSISLRNGFQRLLDWYRESGYLPKR